MQLVGYARVSTLDQSLERQLDELRAHGCDRMFADTASGKRGAHRPQWDACLGHLRRGDALVVTELSRLGRNTGDLGRLLDRLDEHGIGLQILNLGINTTTAAGRLVFTIIGAVGAMERELLVERTLREQVLHIPGLHHCKYCGGGHRGAVFGPIKTRSGEHRRVDLDAGLIGVLIGHRLRQDAEKVAWGTAYVDHDLVFAQEDGAPIPPDRASRAFKRIVKDTGVRSVRLHDLRHGRASLLLASGTDIALVSKLLGHSSLGITVDTYSHLLEGVGRAAAERASALVPRNRPAAPCDQSVTKSRSEQGAGLHHDEGGPGSTGPIGAASENRTPDNLITSEVLYQLS